VKARRPCVSAAALVLILSGCASAGEAVEYPLPWSFSEGFCQRLPFLQLTGAAGFGTIDAHDVEEAYIEAHADLEQETCAVRGGVDVSDLTAPLDRGELALRVMSAIRAEGADEVAERFALESPYDEAYAAYGPYEVVEEPLVGWWSEGWVKVYTQDFSGTRVAATRVTVRAAIIDDNVTANVTTQAQILNDSPERVGELKRLAIDTLRSLEGALEPDTDG
jgi:hypothetical protein